MRRIWLAAFLAALVCAAPAGAAPTVTGRTTLRLDEAITATMRGPQPRSAAIRLVVAGVARDPSGGRWLVRHHGDVRIAQGARALRLRAPTLTVSATTGRGSVIATVGSRRLKVADLTIDPARLTRSPTGVRAAGVRLAMTAGLAARLNRVLDVTFFQAGDPLAGVTTRLRAG